MFSYIKNKILPPQGYREVKYHFNSSKEISVVGLAILNYGSQKTQDTLDYLKKHGVQIIYGLHALPEFKELAQKQHLMYIDATIPDFTAPPLELYETVYAEILAQKKMNKKIAIHCYGGMGRTGTVLAALKLKELSLSPEYAETTASIEDQVTDVINQLRNEPGNASIVEDISQFESLCQYCEQLHALDLNQDKWQSGPG